MKLNFYGYTANDTKLIISASFGKRKIKAYFDFNTETSTVVKSNVTDIQSIKKFIEELDKNDFKLSPSQNVETILNHSDDLRYTSYLYNYSIFNARNKNSYSK